LRTKSVRIEIPAPARLDLAGVSGQHERLDMSDAQNLKQANGFKQLIARLLKAGWITDRNAVLSDGATCSFAIDEFTSLGRERLGPLSALVRPAFPQEFVAYLKGNGAGDPAALCLKWFLSLDMQQLAEVRPKIESLAADLQPPPFSQAEYEALLHIALVFDAGSQPRQARLP
jgi:hypothetical protein